MREKAKLSSKILIALLLALTFLSLGIFSLQKTHTANAVDFTEVTTQNNNFSMSMSANARQSVILPLDLRPTENIVGEQIDFYCFQWRDIESLRFRFRGNIASSTTNFLRYRFVLTYLETEDLTSSLGTTNPETLYQGNISLNSFSQFDFYYYIDSDASIAETANRCTGHDFGLYKFDFIYTYLEDDIEIEVSIGDIYVAILPDDIDSISATNTRLMYTVSSSNRLMNIFNIYLSDSTYRYVNPKYLQWEAEGYDTMNVNYVLTEAMRDSDIDYANCRTLWPALPDERITGTNFVFDSNEIEGTWTVRCVIKNSDGSEKQTLTLQNLSTIKYERPSYVWLILLILCLILLLAGIILLIIFAKKRDKIW